MNTKKESPLRVTIWNEYVHEQSDPVVAAIYPLGIHETIRSGLLNQLHHQIDTQTATLDQPDHGLTTAVLDQTDVLFWWGHAAHDQVRDDIVDQVHQRVLDGMGLVVLHSGHASKIFRRLMGTSCMLRWREAGEKERLWVVEPTHPILEGLNAEFIELPKTEMYGEFFDIPQPDELLLVSWFAGGEVFRSGCTFRRGAGKIFYFRPGHETYPIYHDTHVQTILANAAAWARPTRPIFCRDARQIAEPLEPGNLDR